MNTTLNPKTTIDEMIHNGDYILIPGANVLLLKCPTCGIISQSKGCMTAQKIPLTVTPSVSQAGCAHKFTIINGIATPL